MHSSDTFDIVILGSGVSGSALAMPLSRRGLRVLVVDKTPHPRFSIGESMVPTTTASFERIAKTYGVSELEQIFSYPGLKEVGCTGFPKTGFFFGVHRPGEPLANHEQAVFETLELPLGPDVHMLRSDVDRFLVSRYSKYGIEYLDGSELEKHTVTDDGVDCVISTENGERNIRATLIVDASGPKSALARELGLRKEDPGLKTRTRGIYGHFRNVGSLEDILPPNPEFRWTRDAGTCHHCFPGGWIWVIPFDNGVTSVGMLLDVDKYPLDDALTPEEEFDKIVGLLPTVKQQFGAMEPVFPIIRSGGRIQFSSHTLVSDGVILGPNTGGFIDALFSTGFGIIGAYVLRFVPLAEQFVKQNRSPRDVAEHFRELDRVYFSELNMVDTIVHGTIESFRSFDVFKQYWRLWTTGSMIQFFTRLLGEPEDPSGSAALFGARLESWCDVVEEMSALLTAEMDDRSIALRMKAVMDAQPQPFPPHFTNFDIGSDRACLVRQIDRVELDRWIKELAKLPETSDEMRMSRMGRFGAGFAKRTALLHAKYLWSRLTKSEFHQHIDFIRQQMLHTDHPKAGWLVHFKRPPVRSGSGV